MPVERNPAYDGPMGVFEGYGECDINKPLFRKIIQFIGTNPEQFWMGWWHSFNHTANDWNDVNNNDPAFISCNTAHCVAGLAELLGGSKHSKIYGTFDAYDIGRMNLNLSTSQAQRVFYACDWPEGFEYDEGDIETACRRLQFFIDTNGTDDLEQLQ